MDNAPMTAAELEAAIPEERKAVLRKAADGEAQRILAEAGYEGGAIAEAPDLMNMPRLQSLKTKLKPNSRERRAPRIAAGKLRVVDGALVGAA